MRRLLVGGVALALVSAPAAANAHTHSAHSAKPSLSVSTKTATATESRTAKITVRCGASTSCRGTIALRVAGKTAKARSYAVRSKAAKTYSIKLTAAQLAAIPSGGKKASFVRISEKAPKKIGSRSVAITVRRVGTVPTTPAPTPAPTTPTPSEPTPSAPVLSKAFTERNWTPTAIDTCPLSLHEKYSVIGPEGKLYPTWHPATGTDPATGQSCTFGHEHGDDPATSDIYDWVTDFIDDDASKSRGVPFGYVSEALDSYSAATSSSVVRHEDNPGHKIIVANDVAVVGKDPRTAVKDANGAAIKCDYLIKFHQGSHSSDATKNNAHETLYAIRCTDGTELISSTLTRYGNPNEFDRSCDPEQKVHTSGSDLPQGFGGRRLIPDMYCVNKDVLVPGTTQSDIWSLYEVWESANRIQAVDGTQLASFDPWFGVRNPSRVHAPGVVGDIAALVDTLFLVDQTDNGTAKGYPWDEHAHEHIAKGNPDSPFDGAQRDYYLQGTTVQNPSSTNVWWSDPYGDNAGTVASRGFVRQWISSTDNTGWPVLERVKFDADKDYGKGNGVHAPN